MVLALTLVLLGLVVVLVFNAQVAARLMVRAGDHTLRTARVRAALADAARRAMQVLADDDNLEVDDPSERWARPLELTSPHGIAVWVGISDVNRFFDLNNLVLGQPRAASPVAQRILMDLMTLCGDFTPVERVQALIDWMDPDSDGSRETSWYAARSPAYSPANQGLMAWPELAWVDGFSADYLGRRHEYDRGAVFHANLPDVVTVIPVDRNFPVPININTAAREVLLAAAGLGREDCVDFIVQMRKNKPFKSLEEIPPTVLPPDIEELQPFLDVKSSFFEIKVRAFEGDAAAELLAVVRRERNGEVTVLRWQYPDEWSPE